MRPSLSAFALAALLAAAPGLAGAQDGPWVERRLPWYGLPDRQLIDSAPVSLVAPDAPGACGAVSDRIEPFAVRGPVILRLALKVESGAVGVEVRSGDASDSLSQKKVFTPADGEAVVYVAVRPGTGGRVLALCQAGADGKGGRADILSLSAARPEDLPADEAAKVNLGTL
jgi:hypothetical protein